MLDNGSAERDAPRADDSQSSDPNLDGLEPASERGDEASYRSTADGGSPSGVVQTPLWDGEVPTWVVDQVTRILRDCPGDTSVTVHGERGQIIGVNVRAAEMMGVPWSLLLGHSPLESLASVVGEDGLPLPALRRPPLPTLATGMIDSDVLLGILMPPVRGTESDERGSTRWIVTTTYPIVDPDTGATVAAVSTFDPAPDGPRLRAAMDALVSVYRQLAENVSDVSWRAEVDGRVTWVSPNVTESLGWSPSEMIGRHLPDLVHPDDIGDITAAQARLDDGQRVRVDARILDRTGHHRWVSIVAQPIVDVTGARLGSVGGWTDIDEHVRARRDLARSEERYRLLAANVSDVVIQVNNGGRIVWASPSLQDALGWRPAEWTGTLLEDWIAPEDRDSYARDRATVDSGERVQVRGRVRATSGQYHWAGVHAAPYTDSDGEPSGQIVSFRLIDDDVAREEELEQRARVDALTGLLNRNSAQEHVARLTSERREPGRSAAVLFCDVDDFKRINDTHGHAAGDAVLRQVAERISSTIRADDLAARVGGDEYLVVLHGIHSLDEATVIAEKVRAVAKLPIDFEDEQITATLSVGVALSQASEGAEALIARADAAMYRAKRLGRDRVVAIAEA